MITETVLIVAIGCVTLLGLIRLGIYAVRQDEQDEQKRLLTQPICGCGHHACFHEERSGCHHKDEEAVECGCVKYTGPEYLPTFIAGES